MSKVHLLDRSASELQRVGEDGDFSQMFNLDHIRDGQSIEFLKTLGGDQGLSKMFGVDLNTGIQGDDKVLELRQRFGANIPVKKRLTPLIKLIMECFADLMLQILLVAALVSTIIGIFEENWYEGVTIFFAIFLIVAITAGNNYAKERQFAKLQSKLDELKLQVTRGGKVITIDSKELVVGDLLLFNIGDVFNVDGLYLNGSEVKIDESAMTGESDDIHKVSYKYLETSDPKGKTPFLISGTKVVDGSGLMLVLRVGENTVQGEMKKLGLQENEPTPLQIKLESVAEKIGKIGTIVAILTFLILLIEQLYKFGTNDKEGFFDQVWSIEFLQEVLQYFMIGVTIIVVAVPEGLPLAVTITLAFSVNKMKDEQNLVKTLAACEIMGGANNICSDKTGTLTLNQMTVQTLWTQDKIYQNFQLEEYKNQNKQEQDLFAASILYNSNAYPTKNSNGTFEQIGNKTECALIQYCDQLGYTLDHYRPSNKILRIIPFNSLRKNMMSVVSFKDENYLFVKGASEILLSKCNQYISEGGHLDQLDDEKRNELNIQVIEQFASKALRTIGIAYKVLKESIDAEEDELDQDLILIAIAGIKDPIRPDVPAAIQQCSRSGITVRMVTGDNITTARAIAKDCGILSNESGKQERQYEVMEGKDFRRLTEGLVRRVNDDGIEVQDVANLNKFQEIAYNLKVLARASPEDKFILVTGLKQLDNVVAVTGDGTNDAPALRKADVGFAMGIAGSDVCKESADIILLDDNFSSIITACKWGRNIYNCIRKFIQFQLTVNIVALFMSVLGASILSQAPLNSIQMLWVNLIMDTFASLALATEPPSERLLDKRPYGKRESIVNSIMYRTVIGMSLYQIIVLCIILFFPASFFNIDETKATEFTIEERDKRDYVRLTMFFQTFVLMQIFNSISCRKLDETSMNPFNNLFNNPLFWLINLIELAVQYLLLFFGGKFASVTKHLTWEQQIWCLGLGLGGMVASIFIRMMPARWFRKINVFEEGEIKEDELDQTITSKLRRLSSLRVGSIVDESGKKKSTLRRQSSIYIEHK